ncbi:MAG TPA: hypothetical protein VMB21_09385 [Candidatus Limnocylindria bacterium]|nr:hypothetical protein [Candidatus Limnocylindria bacterium]
MNTNQNLLEQIAQPFVAPRTKAIRPPVRRTIVWPQKAEPALWQLTMETGHSTLAENALFATVAMVSVASIAWLALVTCQFFFAWENLATWVRSAMV